MIGGRRSGWPSHVAAAVTAVALGACCSFGLEAAKETEEEPDDDTTPSERLDLGTAEYPDGNRATVADYPWYSPTLRPIRYRVGYRLADEQADAIRAAYQNFAQLVGHERLSETRFRWRPPPGCGTGIQCVYEELAREGQDSLKPLAELFRKRVRDAKLDALGAAQLVVTFVQEIDYRIPGDEPFGVFPPSLVVKFRWGDCDSKSLLGQMLLAAVGVDSVLISSQVHKHTMLGVALPAPGSSFTWRGTRYAFLETTAKGSPIGHINPSLLRPNDWEIQELRTSRPQIGGERGGRDEVVTVVTPTGRWCGLR
jgi:hypothetical protein